MNTQIEAFEPQSLEDFHFSNSETLATLSGIVDKTVAFPCNGTTGILLYGVYGTGKTTLARLLPDLIEQAYGGESAHVEYISCEQGKRGSDLMTRINKIGDFISLSYSGFHFIVLDEIDNLTAEAQKSLKAVMNRPQMAFIMTTNHVTRVDTAVQDRCYVLELNQPLASQRLALISRLAAQVGWTTASTETLEKIAQQTRGSIRQMSREVMRHAAIAAQNNSM